MEDSTTSQPDSEHLDVHPDTVAFACLSESAAMVLSGIHNAASAYFGFKPKAQWWSSKILTYQAGEAGFRATHRQWGGLWPALSISMVEDKVTKYNRQLREDQQLSGFRFVDIQSGQVETLEGGNFRRLPTLYAEGDFWKLYRFVQEKAVVDDLLRLSRVDRLRRLSRIVEEWAEQNGCQKIERGPKTEEVKPAKPSPACKCACASCKSCAVRGEVKQPTPKQRVQAALDALYDAGRTWVDVGLNESDYWRAINRGIGDLETRMATPAPPRVKLNGGQPR